jgi:hypothetical protein
LRRNRANGSIFLSAFAVLTITGYGLYYAGGERLRAWTSWIHLAVGSGVADFAVDPHLSGKEDTPYGSILNEVTLCVSGR